MMFYQLKEIWAIREQINRSPIIKIPGVTEGSHQGNNENLPKHQLQLHILPTVDGENCLDSHPTPGIKETKKEPS